jgi:hypothetical protein
MYYQPYRNVLYNEKLINIQHVENDLKVYEFNKKIFEKMRLLQPTYVAVTRNLFAGDRILPFARYYVYCYDFSIRFSGERVISVAVFDWIMRVYATADIICGVYPRAEKGSRGQKYLNTRPLRVTVVMKRCTTLNPRYDAKSAVPEIETILDEIITFFLHDCAPHEDRIHRDIVNRIGVCLSLRLTQFLKYAVQLQKLVQRFCYSNCTCGGYGYECRCPIPYSCLKFFGDARQYCSDEVFFEAPE